MKTIVWTHGAARELDRLPVDAKEAILARLDDYAISGAGDVKRLSSRSGYRMRVGAYRIIFAEDATTILAVYVGRRTTATYKVN